MTDSHDVVIVGGGAIGAACARELARAGRRVLVVERAAGGGEAWRAAAGMLAPQVEADGGSPLLELGLMARDHYRTLGPALEATTGLSIGLRQEGIARLAFDEADEEALVARVAWQRQQGLTCHWLDAQEVRTRWDWLRECRGALWVPEEGSLDPRLLVKALLADARQLGATVVEDEITHLERRGSRVIGAVGRGRYLAAEVVLAAGAWSGLVAGVPRPLSVAPIRGQMLALPRPERAGAGIFYVGHGYLLFREEEVLVGSTMEHAGFDPGVTDEGQEQVLEVAARTCPSLRGRQPLRRWAGLRPGTPDGAPLLGREPACEGLWYATGHGRNGILLAGLTGLLLRQMLEGEPTVLEDLSALDPARFWRWTLS